MWRALFLALGISLVIAGAECLVIEKVEVVKVKRLMPADKNASNPFRAASFQQLTQRPKETQIVPIKEWMPWSLLAAGAVVVIYTFSLPRRVGAE